jgi:hypothetical protein
MKLKNLNLKDCAILIGYDLNDKCIYSEGLSICDYYDGTHLWDEAKNVKKMKLRKLRGYLFNSKGVLEQEFVSVFNLETGIYESGQTRFEDGTIQKN